MTLGSTAAQRRSAEALLAASLLAIGALTLGTAPTALPGSRVVVLGSLADVLRNVALFLPFGAALALRGASARNAWIGGFVLAAAIELAQLAIPGRASSPDDVLANALGAGLGFAWVHSAPRWLAPSPVDAMRGRWLALGVWLANLLACAGLTLPALTPSPWYAHWNPALGTLVPYRGAVLEATLAGQRLAHGTLAAPEAARGALRAGEALRLRLISAGPTLEFEGIFLISDAADRELALVAIEGEDLIYRVRSRGRALGLEPAVLRAREAWRGAGVGAPVSLALWRSDAGMCLARDASAHCGLGFGAGSGWTLWLPVLEFPAAAAPWLDALWLAGLALPLGLWWRRGMESWVVVALAAAPLALLPAWGWLLSTGGWLWLAAVSGGLAGRLLALAATGSGVWRTQSR